MTGSKAHEARRPGRPGHPEAYKASVLEAIRARVLTRRQLSEAYGLSTRTLHVWAVKAGIRLHGVPPGCHPDRPLAGKGLCRPCYNVKWREENL